MKRKVKNIIEEIRFWKKEYKFVQETQKRNVGYSALKYVKQMHILGKLISIILSKSYFYLYRMDLVLTRRCTLKCEKCANLMQYYKNPCDVKYETIISSINNLLDSIDYIREIMVLGGEPFIYDKLEEIMAYLVTQEKIGKIILITNGTVIVKSESLLKMLKNPKITVRMSYYGEVSRNYNQAKKVFEENGILVKETISRVWYDYGDMSPRKRTSLELQEQMNNCKVKICKSLLNGELHICPRSSHGKDLGFFSCMSDEYVDLIEEGDKKERRKKIQELDNRKEYITACDYCNAGIDFLCPEVTPGVQLRREVDGKDNS